MNYAHDAGYDAYMTGYIFFHSCKLLKLNIKSMLKNINYKNIFKNKVFILYMFNLIYILKY